MVEGSDKVTPFKSRAELRQEQTTKELEPTFEQITRLVNAAATRLVETHHPELLNDENTSRIAQAAARADIAQMFADAAKEQAIKAAGTELALRDFSERYSKE